ncbi:hypothetical protein [Cohnella sp. GCM10027633]|uniref:hypothetical protein n=1 Tax=unclassified Cohnella TaxID=2636738 RepID=UPI00362A1C4A
MTKNKYLIILLIFSLFLNIVLLMNLQSLFKSDKNELSMYESSIRLIKQANDDYLNKVTREKNDQNLTYIMTAYKYIDDSQNLMQDYKKRFAERGRTIEGLYAELTIIKDILYRQFFSHFTDKSIDFEEIQLAISDINQVVEKYPSTLSRIKNYPK